MGRTNKQKAVVKSVERATPSKAREKHRGVDMYQPEIIEAIIGRVANGESLSSVCDDDKMPSWQTVHKWMREKDEFAAAVNMARAARVDRLIDEVVDIADAGYANVPHAKNQIVTRFQQVAAYEASMEKANRPKDPKVVEAAKDNNGGWKVLENGERANPLSDTIKKLMQEKGLVKNGA
jgi:hypothetical protein